MSNQRAASLLPLARACHPEPTLAVTAVTALLAVDAGRPVGAGVLVTSAVFTGQLTIGWSNDLIDAPRDRMVQRPDKPLARGALDAALLRRALVVVLPLCVALSLLCGVRSGLVHLFLGVGSGWAYNLCLKGTALSWIPYAVAFGALPAVVWLASPAWLASPTWLASNRAALPPAWLMAAAALLGVGAHLVNTLPDLADDAATGVRGLPHRLGRVGSQRLAAAVLLAASLVVVLGPGAHAPAWAWAGLGVAAALAVAGLRLAGRQAFRATIAVAAVDLALLLLR